MKGLLTILLMGCTSLLQAQNPIGGIGQWRSHYDNHRIQNVIEGEYIYVAGPDQIIRIDEQQNITKIDKSTGLHDIDIANLAWDPNNKQLIVVYKNSNIDVIKGDQVYNINAIQLTNLYPNNHIYSIKVFNNWALLATHFGIVVIDLNKHEIKDSWAPNNNNQPTITYDISIAKDSIYAATENGIWKSGLNSNGSAPNQWVHLLQYDQLNIQHLFQNNATHFGYNSKQIFQLPKENPVLELQNGSIQNITNTARSFTICIQYPNQKGALINSDYSFKSSIIIDSNFLAAPMQSLFDKNNNYWVADSAKGLLLKNNNLKWQDLGGPKAPIGGALYINEHQLLAPFGSREKGYALFTEKGWENIVALGNTNLPNFYAVTIDGQDQSRWFTTDDKIVKINNADQIEWIQPNTLSGKYTAIQSDVNNHIWALQDQQGLVTYNNKDWSSIPLPNNFSSSGLRNFIFTKQGHAWLVAPNQQGLYVYQSKDYFNTETWKQLGAQANNGNLNSLNVTSFVEDKTGSVWVGTDNGIAIFNCGDISNEPCNAYLPIVRNNGFNGYLFQHETINGITVDGANRKWIASNKGAWLLSADGMNIIEHFTKDNSPLPNDSISQIIIDPNIGEVFFKSKQQIVSYRGTATEGAIKQTTIQIFPNPVSSTFSGNIAFRGLVENAIVKITDLSGKLLYQTTALGGQAIWNGRTYEGNKVATGIYLVFVRDLTGNEYSVGKIVIAEGY